MSNINKEIRKRSKNYSDEEEVLLVELVEKYHNIIENKKSDAVVWKQKEEAWVKVEQKFAAATGSNRPWKSLRDKYEFIKRKSKAELAVQKSETYRTGGGTSSSRVSNVSSKIAAMLGDSATGLENNYDSDNIIQLDGARCKLLETSIESENEKSISIEDFGKEIICVDENTDWSNWTSLKQAKSKELVVGDNQKRILEVSEKSMSPEDLDEEIVCRKEKTAWSTWTPSSLKQAKSKELVVGGKRKRNLEEEKIELIILQQLFYRDENTRAEEKHRQEMLSLKLKNEILQLELTEKKQKLAQNI